jgi:pantoate--beta-alanine ligase
VSIFVNPAQFGPKEDFKEYPQDFKRDLKLCRKEGVDIVFAPKAIQMYPEGYCAYVNVEHITDTMCGRSRPGHFRGVATVVMKLFNIVKPDIAYFGEKDSQQLAVIKRMVRDLNMPVKIKPMPIVRERNGLAMSSRNAYLDPDERIRALCLHKSLQLARKLFQAGEGNAQRIIQKMREFITGESKGEIDYISVVDPESLETVQKISKRAMVALAVKIGNTRLIDNIMLTK